AFISASPPSHRLLLSSPTRRSSDLPPRRDSSIPTATRAFPPSSCCMPRTRPHSLRSGPPNPRRAHRRGGTRGPTSPRGSPGGCKSEEHTSELQSRENLVCRLLLEKK